VFALSCLALSCRQFFCRAPEGREERFLLGRAFGSEDMGFAAVSKFEDVGPVWNKEEKREREKSVVGICLLRDL